MKPAGEPKVWEIVFINSDGRRRPADSRSSGRTVQHRTLVIGPNGDRYLDGPDGPEKPQSWTE
jgi:hypothetical protein